ncbi:ferrous iron transporter B [Planctomycetes bacterium Pan216]
MDSNTTTLPKRVDALVTATVIGKEGAGKTQLCASLSGGKRPASNYLGATVEVEKYSTGELALLDTPGILLRSDTETTRLALAQLVGDPVVLIVVAADRLTTDLNDLLPLVAGKRGGIVVTWFDQVANQEKARERLHHLEKEIGVPVHAIDARRLPQERRRELLASLREPLRFQKQSLEEPFALDLAQRTRPSSRSKGSIATSLRLLAGVLLLLLPALATIFLANTIAGWLDPAVSSWITPVIDSINGSPLVPNIVKAPLSGEFGLLPMGPFLLVWAFPTVLLYALILGAYKASGLIEAINQYLEPICRPIGLTGRDVVRVMMGLGCNVPAVIATRACSRCTRQPTIQAIAFGAACSYQLPASLSVFVAAGSPWLALVFLGYLAFSTFTYLWLTKPRAAPSDLTIINVGPSVHLCWPSPQAIGWEARSTIRQFVTQAMPVFFVICVAAAYLASSGVLAMVSRWLEPAMALVRLPAEAALPVIMASIRKDGIFLLTDSVATNQMTPLQALVGVFLAGSLLPCIVTVMTIARETNWSACARLLCRQAAAAVGFTLILAWGGALLVAALG